MEKTIKYTVKRFDYIKFCLSRILNPRVIFLFFIYIFLIQILLSKSSLDYIVGHLIMAIGITGAAVLFLCLINFFNASRVYSKDKFLRLETTFTFTDEYMEETTEATKFVLKYKDIYKLQLLKTILLVYISPIRAFVIPKSEDYDIKELYALIKEKRVEER